MTYSIIKVINGNYFVHAEGIKDLSKAKSMYHGLCQTLWNASDVISACVAIMDENLDIEKSYREWIFHNVIPEGEE